ncbi:MAG: hypothetical protein IJG52_08695 [Lachnospiraceae bacterium]|nr:hypothetical protein [Lachnospiraceae bacterium]
MKSEDLFKAMNALPDEMLIRSEQAGKEKTGKKRNHMPMVAGAAAVGMAAGVALMVMFTSPARTRSHPAAAENASSGTLQAAGETADQAPYEDPYKGEAFEEAAPETAGTADSGAQEPAEAASEAAEEAGSSEIMLEAEDEIEQAEERTSLTAHTSADLLGPNKGDYVRVEYISETDRLSGGSPTEPAYSEEGEDALTRAVDEGKPELSLFGEKEDVLYYVYLYKADGSYDVLTVAEGGYVSLSNKPGVRMHIPEAVFEEVIDFFEGG